MRGLIMMRLATLVRRNVHRQLSPNDRGSEAGAIAAIVGIFLGGGVLLGVGALVIDTGSLLYERRQLQSGGLAAAHPGRVGKPPPRGEFTFGGMSLALSSRSSSALRAMAHCMHWGSWMFDGTWIVTFNTRR